MRGKSIKPTASDAAGGSEGRAIPSLRSVRGLDGICSCLTGLCLLNCLATPIVIVSLPALASVLPEEALIHRGLLAFTAPLAVVAFAIGWRRHARALPIACGVCGFCFLFYGGVMMFSSRKAEIAVTLVGSALVIFAHLENLRLRRLCQRKTGLR